MRTPAVGYLAAMADTPDSSHLPFELRPSPIQGVGAFATRRIPEGTRIIEYAGERLRVDW